MDFKAVLRNGCYCLDLRGNTKQEVINEMVDMLIAGGKIPSEHREPVIKAIMDRERKMSTGVQHGVAIPHGKTELIDDLVSAVAIKREGIDFGALDGLPSRIFVMTVSSVLRTGPHLQYLAEISKLLNVPSLRERILNAASVDELLKILIGE